MYLGIDLGTSGVRLVLSDGQGQVLGAADQGYDVAHPRPGWSEQDPADWIAATGRALAALRGVHPVEMAALRGIGLSGQMHGAVLLDEADRVLRPCILWNDTRAAREAAGLDAQSVFRDLAANIVFPGFTAPKLVWLAKHEPEVYARVAKVLLPKDYLRLWLTGGHVSEMSDAAGTAWLDVGARGWSDGLLEASGMVRAQMPGLVEGSAVSGMLRAELAREWGIEGPVVVAGGGGDNAAAACGVGCVDEGAGFVSLGTSGVLLVARDACQPAPETAVHTFCHALPGRWVQMGVILAATDCLNWLARSLGQSPQALSALTGAQLGAPDGPQFLPYLSGERTPHNDARIRAAFIGLDIAHETPDLVRSVMQGVAFALRDSLQALRAAGAAPTRLLAIGGGARSDYWLHALATILNLPLDVPASGELGAALGAARLAIIADTGADPASVMTGPPVARTIAPAADLVGDYDAAYQRYRDLYPALKALI
jgi:xylulokinase